MAYSTIANSEIAVGAPITNSLMTKLRDNPIEIGKNTTGTEGLGAFAGTNSTTYTSSTTWVVPSRVRRICVICGGGGGGGGAGGDGGYGHGGGAGGVKMKFMEVDPGETLTITVGAGGGNGAAGSSSSVSGSLGSALASGGAGGATSEVIDGAGAGGGSALSSFIDYFGNSGEVGTSSYGGAGGEQVHYPVSGAPGARKTATGDGNAASGYCHGGGGRLGTRGAGGAGAPGFVIIIY